MPRQASTAPAISTWPVRLLPLGEVPAGFRRERRCVIALDNYSVHHSQAVTDYLPRLQAASMLLA